MRRPVSLLLALLAVLVMSATACAGGDATTTASATRAPVTTVVSDVDLSCAKPGVVRPNCGKAPEDAGDRGGTLQYVVWALLVGGLATVFTVVFRSATRTDRAKQVEVGDRNWS